MDVIQTIESAAGAAVEAVEHPFHTIGHRLTAIGQHPVDVIQTIESAAGAAVEAVEHPFHTIGHRLTAIGQHIASLMGHPYGAPPMVDALTTLHSVLIDLHQEVAELRTPCPCRPASTNAAPARSVAEVATVIDGLAASPADLAEFAEWKRAKAAAELTNQTGA